MTDTIDDAEEQALLSASKRAADLVEKGSTPNEAIEKVARDSGFMPGQIRTLCYAYNTGRQLEQMRGEDETTLKFADFPLADPVAVIDKIYPNKKELEKTSVDSEYLRPPGDWAKPKKATVKSASATPFTLVDKKPEPLAPDPETGMKRAHAKYERAKIDFEESRRLMSHSEDMLLGTLQKVAHYFRQHGAMKVAVAEEVSRSQFGNAVTLLFDAISGHPWMQNQKRAGDDTVIRQHIDLDAAPFTLIATCVKLAREINNRRADCVTKEAAYKEAAQVRTPPFPGASSQETTPNLFVSATRTKEAVLGSPAFGAAMGSGIAKFMGEGKTRSDLVNDTMRELDDPNHQNELRKIQAHAMLTQFMTNPDNAISGYDPDQVINAFNDISRLAPRVSEQPSAMEPLLQRRLAGNIQPFETKEITDIEKGIMQSRTPGAMKNESLMD